MGDNTDRLPNGGEEVAANSRMFYEVHVADIREFKKQEWHVAYMTFLLFGAIVTAARLLSHDSGCNPLLTTLIVIIATAAIFLIWKTRCNIIERRNDLHKLYIKLGGHGSGPPCPCRDIAIPCLLTMAIIAGTSVAALIVYNP